MSIQTQLRIVCDYCGNSRLIKLAVTIPGNWQENSRDGNPVHCCHFPSCLTKYKEEFPDAPIITNCGHPRKSRFEHPVL